MIVILRNLIVNELLKKKWKYRREGQKDVNVHELKEPKPKITYTTVILRLQYFPSLAMGNVKTIWEIISKTLFAINTLYLQIKHKTDLALWRRTLMYH